MSKMLLVPLKDVPVGHVVEIRGVVVSQKSGQTHLSAPGVGDSGIWSVVNSVSVMDHDKPDVWIEER